MSTEQDDKAVNGEAEDPVEAIRKIVQEASENDRKWYEVKAREIQRDHHEATRRWWTAAMAMQGLLANAHYVEGLEDDFPDEQAHQEEHVALRSVIFADALLAALETSK